jgi:NAD(P)-dependent dehydrogenase (short-subunit alcohol dehydrogenase family)
MAATNVPQLSLAGKTALITGATGAIGQAVSQAFGLAGASLFLTSGSEEHLRANVQEFARWGVQAACLATDLTQPGAPQEVVDYALQSMGGIDILVNNAGIKGPQTAEEASQANWDAIMDSNLQTASLLSRVAGSHMIGRGGGRIINISPDAGLAALPQRAAYCSSQSGLHQLTSSLALEWAVHNITVNAVAPSLLDAPWMREMFKDPELTQYAWDGIPLGRLAKKEEVAHAVLYLASEFAGVITGNVLLVDGGWNLQPEGA